MFGPRSLLVALAGIISVLFFATWWHPVLAASPNYLFTTTRTYQVAATGNGADVELKTTVLYQKGPGYYLPSPTASFTLSLVDPKTPDSELENQRKSIKVTDSKGRTLNFTASKKGRGYTLTVTYPDPISSGQSYTITVRYHNDEVAYRLGETEHIVISGYTKDTAFSGTQGNNTYQINESITLRAPKNLLGKDLVTVLYPDPQKITAEGNNQIYEWPASSLLGQSIGMVAGTEQLFRFEFKNKAVATQQQETIGSRFLKNTYKISVPYDIPEVGQSVVFDYIDPLPDAVEITTVGSWKVPYFVYYVSPTEEKQILISGYLRTTKPYTKAQLADSKISALPPGIVSSYTAAEQYWETDNPQIQQVALQLKQQHSGDLLFPLVEADYQYVINRLTYDNAKIASRESNLRLGAVQALETQKGVCMEFADLLVAILRAQGIPAIAANGAGYDRYDQVSDFIGHQWVMVYFPTYGWVPVDPTWGDNGGDLIGPDLLHAYFGLMPEGQSQDSFLVSYLGWDAGFSLSLPTVFVHTVGQLPTSSAAQDAQKSNFMVFDPAVVEQQAAQDATFASYPFVTIADVQSLVEVRAKNGSISDKIGTEINKLQSSAWGKILVDRAPIIGGFLLVIIIVLLGYRVLHRNKTMSI